MSGLIEVWIPDALRHQKGNYAVQVKTVNGISNAVNITVRGFLQLDQQKVMHMNTVPTGTATPEQKTTPVRPAVALIRKDSVVKPKTFTAVQAIH